MSGMVKEPVVATLAMALPVMEPMRAEEMTEEMAGPPAMRRPARYPTWLKKVDAPVTPRTLPNTTKRKM